MRPESSCPEFYELIKSTMSMINEPKKRGRPSVESEQAKARIQQPMLGELDAWAAARGVTRAEAVRRLIELGLKAQCVLSEEDSR